MLLPLNLAIASQRRQVPHNHEDRIAALEEKIIIVDLQSRSVTGSVDDSQTDPPRRHAPANEVERRVTHLENKTANLEVLLAENNRNMEDLRQQNTSLTRQLEAALETLRRLERKVESHEHVQAIRNVALADLEEYVRQQQVCSYDGALLWKIDDYARRKNDAISGRQTSFYSPCFYTSRHGYKMCARIYLNGDGMGRGTHISVFFVVMRGQYERPRREMNIASGCPLFCSFAKLDKHAYVRDDVMFLKITVDTFDS